MNLRRPQYSDLSANRLSFEKWATFKWLAVKTNCVMRSFSQREVAWIHNKYADMLREHLHQLLPLLKSSISNTYFPIHVQKHTLKSSVFSPKNRSLHCLLAKDLLWIRFRAGHNDPAITPAKRKVRNKQNISWKTGIWLTYMKMLSQNLRLLLVCSVACRRSPKKIRMNLAGGGSLRNRYDLQPLLWAWAVWTCGHAVLRFVAFPLASAHNAMKDG